MRQFSLKTKTGCHFSLKASVGFDGTGILGSDQKQKVSLGFLEMYRTGNGTQIGHEAVLQPHKWQCFGLRQNAGVMATE